MRYELFSKSIYIHKKKLKKIQLLSSTTIKLYGQYAHTSNLIIPDNHIAYVLNWVSIRIEGIVEDLFY